MRAERLAKRGYLKLLSDMELHPRILAEKISNMLDTIPVPADIMLHGDVRTAEQLTALAGKGLHYDH
jgi:predicted glycosyltransferase